MDIKIEPNLDANTSIGEVYEAHSSTNLTQYSFDEYNLQYINHESPAGLSTGIKQELDELSEYACMSTSQDVLNIKQETIQISDVIPVVVPNVTKLIPDEAIILHSVLDPKSNKEKKYYKCSTCHHLFSYRRQLICHLRTHTGEKPYSCPWCDYKSTQKVNLTCHIRRNHTGEKPYSCTFCNFKSATKYQLICHMRIHTGEKPFSCFFCEYRCAHKVDMIRHMRTHTGEKPFACTFCDHKCADKRDLTHHVRIHTGEKPFICDVCGYKCVKKSYLNAHVKVHTGEKPFGCDFCNYRCSRKAVLNRHLKTHAGGKHLKKGAAAGLKTVKIITIGKGPINDCDRIKEPAGSLLGGKADDSRMKKIKIEEIVIKEENIEIE